LCKFFDTLRSQGTGKNFIGTEDNDLMPYGRDRVQFGFDALVNPSFFLGSPSMISGRLAGSRNFRKSCYVEIFFLY